MKNRFYVIDECALVIVDLKTPTNGHILARNYKGAEQYRSGDNIHIEFHKNIRPATLKDFDEYRIHPCNYQNKEEYDFPTV